MAFIFRFPLVPKGLIVVRERASGSKLDHIHYTLQFHNSDAKSRMQSLCRDILPEPNVHPVPHTSRTSPQSLHLLLFTICMFSLEYHLYSLC
ncbi:hypothetical protein D0Y65_005428 [Glycine soja]|uniref:Uncharacterized protein n=1 Tax=Glycine soja TaxID=3848 RepID=A0A445LVN9_GLYSO|nr:hypothetical protein D0Y65_005428 [Glycine soja]